MRRKIFIALFTIAAVIRYSDCAAAEPVADFFKGKTINIVVPFGAGGTSQDYAMLMSRNLGRFIPGNPTVTLQSMPGAGGLRATLYAYSVAPKDGTWVLLPPDSIAVSQLITPSEARYDTRKFSWLGTVTQTRSVLAVRSDRGVKTVDDLRRIEVFVGSSGSGSQTDMYPTLTNALLGTRLEVVKGYEGSGTSTFAVESGELHGTVNTWGYWQRRLGLFENGFLVPILQYGLGRQPELPDVPNFIELVDDEDGKQMIKFFSSFGPIGRGLALPPGVPTDRAAALKQAFAELIKDPVFLDQARRADLSIEPLMGDTIDRFIADVIATPPAIVARVRSLLYSK
jgi:tripartite-type tricarboxylate transporter receptor subunit TctC